MMRGALFLCLVLLPVRRFAVLSRLGRNIAHAVYWQVFLPPSYPTAVHVTSHTRLSPVLVYYGFKGRSLYARRGEPGDEASHQIYPYPLGTSMLKEYI